MDFKRARSGDQIQTRIDEIVSAASDIYNAEGYEGLTFSKISEHTKFTRPNIYKYFANKDEILLLIMSKDYRLFVADLLNSFKFNKVYTLHEIAEIWTDAIEKHQRLLELNALLTISIERNVSLEALVEFKRERRETQLPLVNLVSQLFPNKSNENIVDFIRSQFVFAFGLHSITKRSSLSQEANELAGIGNKIPKFRQTYMEYVYKIIYCLENEINMQTT